MPDALHRSNRSRALRTAAILVAAATLGACSTLGTGTISSTPRGTVEPELALSLANADYPVPIPTALNALRPPATAGALDAATLRTLAVAVDAGTRGHSSAAFELAPLLIADRTSLAEFLSGRLTRLALRPRISLGFTSGDTTRAALAVRFMLHDDADLRADSAFALAVSAAPPEHRAVVADSARNALAAALWNRSVFELALAAVYSFAPVHTESSTATLEALRILYAHGVPVFDRSGQLVAGVSATVDGRREHALSGAVELRAVYGTRSERALVGVRLALDPSAQPQLRAGLGAILRLTNGIWLRPGLDLGLRTGSGADAFGSLTLCLGTPEPTASH